MRNLTLSLALLAAAALTPAGASAQSYYYTPNYGNSYYAPSYYTPGPYYTTSTFGGYTTVAPVAGSYYYTPSYYSTPGTTYYYSPNPSYNFAPIYSGPQYFHGYAPNRLWIYPDR